MPPFADEIRKHDYYRYLCCLLAPEDIRNTLITIYAFNNEITKIPYIITEPMAGHIRLQWWRDAIDEIYKGKPTKHKHEVVSALYEILLESNIDKSFFHNLIDAREADIEFVIPVNTQSLQNYAVATSSNLFNLIFSSIGVDNKSSQEAAHYGGIAFALVGIMRSIKYNSYHGKVMFPADLMKQAGITEDEIIEGNNLEKTNEITKMLCDKALVNLQHAHEVRTNIPKYAKSVMLPICIIKPFVKRIAKNNYDLFNSDLESNRLAIQYNILKGKLLGGF